MSCIILLPVFNGEPFLKMTLDAIFAQTHDDFHLVLIDDASTDGSLAILRAYGARYDARVTLVENTQNLGVATVLDRCFREYANADYIAMTGQDDCWAPNYLQRQLESLAATDALVSFGGVTVVDGSGAPVWLAAFDHERLPLLDEETLFLSLLARNFLCSPASVLAMGRIADRARIHRMLGLWNERLQDYELWLNLSLRGSFVYTPEAKCDYRWHTENLSRRGKQQAQGRVEVVAMLRRVLWSDAFFAFRNRVQDPAGFCTSVAQALHRQSANNPDMRLLTMEFCEIVLADDILSEAVDDVRRAVYQDLGMLSKAMQGGKSLTVPLTLVRHGTTLPPEVSQILRGCKSLRILDTGDGLGLWVGNDPSLLPDGLAVAVCSETALPVMRRQRPKALVLSQTLSSAEMERSIIAYAEDGGMLAVTGKVHGVQKKFLNALTKLGMRKVVMQIKELYDRIRTT